MSYNLLDEKWIPVLYRDGRWERVGIRKALEDAARIRQIAASNPMDRVAILRFLLALLYWCKGNPVNEADPTRGDPFPSEWFSKLEGNKDCFNLLGEGKRFSQYRKSKPTKDEKLSANYLIHEVPTGNNLWHFRHATDRRDGLCRACCAMGLLRLPLFATSGGSGKPPGVNAKPPVYVMRIGVSLAATLRLSWREVSHLGTPAWEKPDTQLSMADDVPLLMGLTWLPRRVWLDNPEEPDVNCISCGRKEPLIRSCVFAGIGSMKSVEDGSGRVWHDPHVSYAVTGKRDVTSLHSSNALGASDAAAGQWSRIMAGMLRDASQVIPDCPAVNDIVSAWSVGFSTVQNDKYLEATEWLVPFPRSPHHNQEFIEKIERWEKEGSNLARKIRSPIEKANSRKHIEIQPMLAAIRPHVEETVFAKVGELLTGGDDAWDRAAEEYRPMMEMIAHSLSPGFTLTAVQRRQHIASAMPDMQKKTGAEKKPKDRKGGGK